MSARGRPQPDEFATLGLTQRLDLALAHSLLQARPVTDAELETLAQTHRELVAIRGPRRWRWIAGTLRLRGLRVHDDDVRCIFARARDERCRIATGTQEHKLVCGLGAVLDEVVARAERRQTPTGGSMVGLFELLVADLARFRNNVLRQDAPWDGVLYVPYPEPDRLEALLGEFDEACVYRDFPAVFRRLHPVRRAFRVFWRFARIAPFPDFNLVMAFVAMTQYLLAHGYPPILPDRHDRDVLLKMVASPPPTRFVRFENRLLASLEP